MVVPLSFVRKGTHSMRRDPHSAPSATRVKGLFVALLAAVALTACSSNTAQTFQPAVPTPTPLVTPTHVATAPPTQVATPTLPPTPTATVAATPTTAPSPTSSAITVTGDDGVAITLPAPPEKVVSLTPATSELIFALGEGDKLVGRTDSDDYPPQVADVPVVATFQGVQTEKVV